MVQDAHERGSGGTAGSSIQAALRPPRMASLGRSPARVADRGKEISSMLGDLRHTPAEAGPV